MHIIPNFKLKKKIVKRILPLVMALFQGIMKLFGILLDDLNCVSAIGHGVAGGGLHVILLLQVTKKLFSPL
jgi:hypothetical protein